MATELSRRDRVMAEASWELASLWRQNIRATIRLELGFSRGTQNLEALKQLWGAEEGLCQMTQPDQLQFPEFLA